MNPSAILSSQTSNGVGSLITGRTADEKSIIDVVGQSPFVV